MSNDQQEGSAPEVQWPVTVTLKHPFEFDDERITKLEFRRGKLGDLKGMKLDAVPPIDHLILLASRMCGQPVKVIEKLDGDDSSQVLEIALSFFNRCLGAGS